MNKEEKAEKALRVPKSTHDKAGELLKLLMVESKGETTTLHEAVDKAITEAIEKRTANEL